MKQFLIYFVFFVGIQFLLSSCHTLVDDEFPNYEPKLVLNGLLQADSTIRVQLSLTANLTDTTPNYISNARVIIESNVAAPDTLIYAQKGWYISVRTAKAGANYSCRAEIQGFSTISAQTTIPFPTTISDVLYTDLAGRGEEAEKISSFEFTIANTPTQSKYWEVQLLSAGMRTSYNYEMHDWIEKYEEQDEYIYLLVAQDSILLGEANPLNLFSNKRIKGSSYKVKFYLNSTYTNLDDTDEYKPVVVLKSVDESYYRYIKQYYIYETSGYATIGQAQQFYPLYTNVKNGLGVFTGMSVTRKELLPLTPKGE